MSGHPMAKAGTIEIRPFPKRDRRGRSTFEEWGLSAIPAEGLGDLYKGGGPVPSPPLRLASPPARGCPPHLHRWEPRAPSALRRRWRCLPRDTRAWAAPRVGCLIFSRSPPSCVAISPSALPPSPWSPRSSCPHPLLSRGQSPPPLPFQVPRPLSGAGGFWPFCSCSSAGSPPRAPPPPGGWGRGSLPPSPSPPRPRRWVSLLPLPSSPPLPWPVSPRRRRLVPGGRWCRWAQTG